MIRSNGMSISVLDCFGRRDDVTFIDQFEWNKPEHLKLAVQVWLASRLAAVSGGNGGAMRRHHEEVADEEIRQIQMRLASNPKTPPVVLAYLARNAQRGVRERLAENPQAPGELLYELACDEDSDVRCAVADNSNTPRFVLELLMVDEDADVRYRLAENANLAMELLTRLCAEDSNPYVAARASATLARLSCGRVFSADFSERFRARNRQSGHK
jgi:hypothetical protein